MIKIILLLNLIIHTIAVPCYTSKDVFDKLVMSTSMRLFIS